jgi:hypothetical protein
MSTSAQRQRLLPLLARAVSRASSGHAAHKRLGSRPISHLWVSRLGGLQLSLLPQRPLVAAWRVDRVEVRAPALARRPE